MSAPRWIVPLDNRVTALLYLAERYGGDIEQPAAEALAAFVVPGVEKATVDYLLALIASDVQFADDLDTRGWAAARERLGTDVTPIDHDDAASNWRDELRASAVRRAEQLADIDDTQRRQVRAS